MMNNILFANLYPLVFAYIWTEFMLHILRFSHQPTSASLKFMWLFQSYFVIDDNWWGDYALIYLVNIIIFFGTLRMDRSPNKPTYYIEMEICHKKSQHHLYDYENS